MDCNCKKANKNIRSTKKNNNKEKFKMFGKYNNKSARIQQEKRLKQNEKILKE